MKKGFTLIELLVVIAIIGLLSSVVLASLNTARMKSRDARRLSDLSQISKALELYYDDNSTYAVSGAGWDGGGTGWFNHASGRYTGSIGGFLSNLGYTGGEIIDPSGNTTGQAYMIVGNTSGYTIWTRLENPTTEQSNTLNTCMFSSYDSGYNMNYCVSN